MKKLALSVLCFLLALSMTAGASACTSLYVGANLTENGNMIFGRIEDMANSMNKLFSVIPSGVHQAGESYDGCYGFQYTFSHDSYGYTAFMDDNLGGVCPDCDSGHAHTPYQAGGTNEKGFSMSATETLYPQAAIRDVDDYVETGIEEAEITTVLLSEAGSAKEALDLLLSIYDSAGCANGSGIFLADPQEIWYVENCSGTQYVAVKLNADMIFVEPNVSVIGLIDLDDTENVIASEKLIATAVAAGTFVGDEEKNIIDFSSSYTKPAASERMVNALNYINPNGAYDSQTPAEAFCISNVAADGGICPLYTPITPAKNFTVADVIHYFQVDAIGKAANLETHFFEIDQDAALEVSTVEWISMDDNQYSLFVPYFPLLTSAAYEGYWVGTEKAAFVTEAPAEGFFYPATANQYVDGQRVKVDGFKVLPEGWEKSCYWCADALSNYLLYVDGSQADFVKAELAKVQQQFLDEYAQMAQAAQDGTATAEAMTAKSMAMAKTAHDTIYQLLLTVSAQ